MLNEPGYLDVCELISKRQWTRSLIKKHLGHPDRIFPVNHYRNYSGKHAWLQSTIELAEMTQGFEKSFLHGARIRRLQREDIDEVIERIYHLREQGPTAEPMASDNLPAEVAACAHSVAAIFEEARRRGYRTPHKC